jgi:hypothetical protein
MTLSVGRLTLTVPAPDFPMLNQTRSGKTIIVKADDLTGITPNWNRFFDMSRARGVKVSAGIICNTLEGDTCDFIEWMHKLLASGWVEFWNHGWDHRRWMTEEKMEISEFGGSGYEHQKMHYGDAKKIMTRVFGSAPIAFGTPYNAIDADTVTVINEDADLQLFYCYKNEAIYDKVLVPIVFNVEGDGTGKPNFEKFVTGYARDKEVALSAIQFHPNSFNDAHFSEYVRIIDFLVAEGWTFMLPSEFVAAVKQGPS